MLLYVLSIVLFQVYKEGKKLVVDGLILNFYEGQIILFFGYNGVGKIIIMFILMGLFLFIEGIVYIYGCDICMDMEKICCSLGMCLQYNVLFDRLVCLDFK